MIYVCGDTHHDIDYRKLNSKNWPDGKELTKDDYLIVAGDFGLIWYGSKNRQEEYMTNWYNDKPWTTLFIDGNHENFDRLFSDEFPEVEMFGSKVKQISDSIFYLQRGHVYTIQDHKFFTFGGGSSIDKARRTEHVSWWRQEIPSMTEMRFGMNSLKEVNNEVDFVIAHSCPHDIFYKLSKIHNMSHKEVDEEKPLRDYLTWISENVSFKEWHFGHFHYDEVFDKKYYLHYIKSPRRLV